MGDKAEAFRSFDFDGNEKWKQYHSSLEIPAGRNVDDVLLKFKAKWYRREIDPDFEVDLVLKGSKPAPATTGRPSASNTEGTPQNGSRGPQSTSTSGPPKGFLGRLLSAFASNHQERLFYMHAALLLLFVLHLQPLSPILSARAWGYFMQTALLSHAYKVFLKYGAPQIRPFSLEAIKAWLAPASASTDFQYALIALIFIPSRPILLVAVPMLTLAVYHFFAYASRQYSHTGLWQRYGVKAHQWLQARQQQALLYNAAAEIGGGMMTIISLLSPPRSFFLVFIYWQFLRMRFWSPDAANYHRMAWSQLDAKFGRYLNYIPLLRTPIGYVQRWFLNPPRQ